jgi:methyl-accepting chemotaxis protein
MKNECVSFVSKSEFESIREEISTVSSSKASLDSVSQISTKVQRLSDLVERVKNGCVSQSDLESIRDEISTTVLSGKASLYSVSVISTEVQRLLRLIQNVKNDCVSFVSKSDLESIREELSTLSSDRGSRESLSQISAEVQQLSDLIEGMKNDCVFQSDLVSIREELAKVLPTRPSPPPHFPFVPSSNSDAHEDLPDHFAAPGVEAGENATDQDQLDI